MYFRAIFFILLIAFSSCKFGNQNNADSKYQSVIDSLSKIDKTVESMSKQISKNPTDAELYFSRGNVFYQMHQLTLAAADLHKAIELDSTKTSYYLTFADINIDAHFIKVALQYLQKAKKIEPTNRELAFKLAKTYLYLKEYDAVITETNSVLAVDQTNSDAYFLQGMVWKEKSDTIKALTLFKVAADNNPDNYNAYMQLGLLNMYRNKNLAEKYLQNALRIDSSKYEGNYALAMLYQQYGDYKKTIAIYKKMILKTPEEVQPVYNLGCVYFNMDSMERAFNHFNLAINISPTSADAFYMRGLCWQKRNNKTQAIRDFESALKLRNDFREALEALGKLKTI
jgi:tetratricopeptide (TPR) repeat protein